MLAGAAIVIACARGGANAVAMNRAAPTHVLMILRGGDRESGGYANSLSRGYGRSAVRAGWHH